jgi:hypothetical protein
LRLSIKRAGSPEARPTPSLTPALFTRPSRRPCFCWTKVDGGAAGFGVGELGLEEVAGKAVLFELGEQRLHGRGDAADDDDLCAFGEAGAGDGLADAGGAAADEDDVVFEAEVHGFLSGG